MLASIVTEINCRYFLMAIPILAPRQGEASRSEEPTFL